MKEKKLGTHYHKDNDGYIYKYYFKNMKEENNAIYICSENLCKSKAILNLNKKKFEILVNHCGYYLHRNLKNCNLKDKYVKIMKVKGFKDIHLLQKERRGKIIDWAK